MLNTQFRPDERLLIIVGITVVLGATYLYTSSSLRTKDLANTDKDEEDDEPVDPTNYALRARRILRTTPLIDGHNDFPFLLRQQLHSKIYEHDFLTTRLSSHSDFQKMKDGMMGGQFWSVFVPVPEDLVPGVDLDESGRRVMGLNEPNVRIVSVPWSLFSCSCLRRGRPVLIVAGIVGGPRHARAD
jgi:hypothetical protein